jgi:hypothetical protein
MRRQEFLATMLLWPSMLTRAVQTDPLKVIVQNRYFAKPGKGDEVYQWRLHACDVIEKLGSPRGIVLRGRGDNEPDAIWQVEFQTREAARTMSAAVTATPEFKAVEAHMGTLIRRFESSLLQELRPAIIE